MYKCGGSAATARFVRYWYWAAALAVASMKVGRRP
jgi:hypothetical protein